MIRGVRQEDYYKAIQYIHISEGYPIEKLCRKLNVNRSAYYKWRKRTPSGRQIENEQIVELTTVPWRDFGVFSNPKCIISESLLRVTI